MLPATTANTLLWLSRCRRGIGMKPCLVPACGGWREKRWNDDGMASDGPQRTSEGISLRSTHGLVHVPPMVTSGISLILSCARERRKFSNGTGRVRVNRLAYSTTTAAGRLAPVWEVGQMTFLHNNNDTSESFLHLAWQRLRRILIIAEAVKTRHFSKSSLYL